MDEKNGQKLLGELMAAATAPGCGYVHTWNKGDVVMWDNRAQCIAAGHGLRTSRATWCAPRFGHRG